MRIWGLLFSFIPLGWNVGRWVGRALSIVRGEYGGGHPSHWEDEM